MATTLLGTPMSRVDGRLKVTGAAQYAAEFILAGMTHAVLVGSAAAGGSIKSLDVSEAERAPGVLLVLTHQNRGSLAAMPATFTPAGTVAEERLPLADTRIHHAGQYVAMVVAESLEQARYAAALVRVEYEPGPFAVAMNEASETTYRPQEFFNEPCQHARGDVALALGQAPARFEATYTTPNEHPCALEPHAAIASWSDGSLTIYNASQWVLGDRNILAIGLGLPPEKIHVICPFTGGMFGSKAATGGHVVLAALATRQLGRPVKIVLTREQVLVNVGHRSETVQNIRLGAEHDGRITALEHSVKSHTGLNDEFVELASSGSRMLYNVPNYAASHELVRLNVMKPAWMRAPGEAPGMFALESALDELSYQLDIDPVELRRRNHAEINLNNGKPFSSKHLLECYTRGAERFGWADRRPQPRSMRAR